MNYANAVISFKDQIEDDLEVIIKLSCDGCDEEDDFVFYWCNDESSVKALMEDDNGEDFIVRNYWLVDSPWD